ncbi:MAG: hypothetical protein GVY29_08425 [Spirochaetes bacterium]|nr:hypothetical protein [Spirochaetota bacterium]
MYSRVLRAARISYAEMFEFARVRSGILRALLAPFFILPSFSFALHIAGLDRRLRRCGVVPAMRWVLRRYYGGLRQSAESIPQRGGVLLVGNHPGLGDLPALAVAAGRVDLTVVAKERALMADMTGILSRCIVIDASLRSRAEAMRTIVLRVREGAAVVVYPAGEIEPDPGLLPDSGEFLHEWSPAFDSIVARLAREDLQVPIVPVYTEGVHYAPRAVRSLLASRRSDDSFERRAAVLTLGMRLGRLRRVRVIAGVGMTPAALLAGGQRSPSDHVRGQLRLLHSLRRAGAPALANWRSLIHSSPMSGSLPRGVLCPPRQLQAPGSPGRTRALSYTPATPSRAAPGPHRAPRG